METKFSKSKRLVLYTLFIVCSVLSTQSVLTADENKPKMNSDKTQTTIEPAKTDNVSSKETTPLTAVPVPRHEEPEWTHKHDVLVKKAKEGGIEIAFYGDSITDWMNVDLLHKVFGPKACNLGISGDCTEHLLWRLQNGEADFSGAQPKVAVILIGTNNLPDYPDYHHSTNEEVCFGVKTCIQEIQKRVPGIRILLLGILPRDEMPDTPLRKRIKETNELLIKLEDPKQKIFYADIGLQLLQADGKMSTTVMYDFLHPTKDTGYQPMFDAIKPHLDKVLASK